MHHRLFRWLRHNTLLSVSSLSVSSLVWMAVSSAPVLAQGESETQAPPAAATPQPQVVSRQPPAPTQAQVVATQNEKLDAARNTILAPLGAGTYQISHQDIESLPQGVNTGLDKVLLQAPGVTQDSAASGDLHVRNEHANVQFRINGLQPPDGVGAFGQILDTGFIGSLSLITGALPAQYGLRTPGLVDIQTKTDAFNNPGSVSLYGGSHQTISPYFEYGGTAGQTQYYLTGRYLQNNLGIENPPPTSNAIHHHTNQKKGFAYVSTVIDPTSRLTYIGGTYNAAFQIPNNPGQPANFTAFGLNSFNSALLNERQFEFTNFNVVAYQKSMGDLDYQISYFNRYNQLHFRPDPVGDILINGIASDVYRQSVTNGIQEDTAYRIGYAHTLRFGFSASSERSLVNNVSTVLPVDPVTGNQTDPITGAPFGPPFTVFDSSSKLGWLIGTYVQDEWKITNQLTLNTGLRFDQMFQYVDANQLSPRVSLTWKPTDGTMFHVGYARSFTQPVQGT